ncbi:MAG: hypothetical protein US45_C0042G0002 [Candidatus Nomurabacteria bacterium GW2011_GWA1_37_20]|uniref:Uncharacterized protein n=2 Tax=Parcubacteria group TaxID=1794811 RepID=A0A0G0HTC9_9BACT|nr:MAG: hypothetical protein US45_C0042G0002 [Candidatus Nomurabacteria bacterium GW2011_GWA1_37_20]KKQ45542.1 MAG: hypothetical protein US65_C0052G0003 [Candidatus Yanofskybacteria bacterium GW2011_GWC2_37_9]
MEPEKKSNGSLVGLVVIIIILIIGGIYIWLSNQKLPNTLQNSQTQSESTANQDAAALDALELDAEATDTSTGVDVDAIN